jgi:hypothetical protein
MNDKDIKRLRDVAKLRLKRKYTKEESLKTLVMAGILNWDDTYTDNFPYLKAWEAEKKAAK